jgi:TfoX/Sxy family transcriptional regulator of competence genes
MAFDEVLAARARTALGRRRALSERKMFGGLIFMLHGNMVCGVAQDALMLRLGKEGVAAALSEPHTRAWDLSSQPIASFVLVSPAGFAADLDLHSWIDRAVTFALSLPPK